MADTPTRYIRVDVHADDGSCSMTGIQVCFEGYELKDFETAKAKALGHIVHELSRYGLHEALGGIGIRPTPPHVTVNGDRWTPESR